MASTTSSLKADIDGSSAVAKVLINFLSSVLSDRFDCDCPEDTAALNLVKTVDLPRCCPNVSSHAETAAKAVPAASTTCLSSVLCLRQGMLADVHPVSVTVSRDMSFWHEMAIAYATLDDSGGKYEIIK